MQTQSRFLQWRHVWTKKRLFWLCAGLSAVLIHILLAAFPSIAENVYGKGVYPVIRMIFRWTLGLLPIPGIVLILAASVWLLWVTGIRPLIRRQVTFPSFLAGLISTIGAVVFLFQSLWGFNYAREGIDTRLGLQLEGLTTQQLRSEFERATTEMLAAFEASKGYRALEPLSGVEYEAAVRELLEAELLLVGYSVAPRPRVRLIRPKGLLMRWNTAGIYLPFSGEGHVDAGMLPVQTPFTVAHEMAHGYGVTDEGDCNFLAYLTCRKSGDPDVRFAGVLSYWRYVASEFRFVFSDDYSTFYETLPQGIRDALIAIRENNALYPDIFPKLRDTVYDSYLKTQGVQEGLLSYSRVVQLVHAYEQHDGSD